jgi:hypothetical protein
MKSLYQPKKRHKSSKFDPYMNEISEYLSAGMSTGKIAETIEHYFDDVVSKDALYVFIRSRGLKNRVTQGGTNLNYKAPKCQECKCCYTIKALDGESNIRICDRSERVIGWAAQTSPVWCEKRGEERRANRNGFRAEIN